MEIMKEKKTPGNTENLMPTFPWKATSKETFLLGKKIIRANKTVCGILKNSYKLPFLYTPPNAEFRNNSSARKNSGFVEESIKKMLRAGTVKECLTKPKLLNPIFSVNKRQKAFDFRLHICK